MQTSIRFVAVLAVLLSSALPGEATDGHVLHGSGAINESLGGAGVARAFDVLGGAGHTASWFGPSMVAGMLVCRWWFSASEPARAS